MPISWIGPYQTLTALQSPLADASMTVTSRSTWPRTPQLACVTLMMRSETTCVTVATWPERIEPIALNTSTEPSFGAAPCVYLPIAWFHQYAAAPNNWMPEKTRAKGAHCQKVWAFAAD